MISPERARRLVIRHCSALGRETVAIDDSMGFVLARDVRTPFPLPRFDNSAMDGFALRSDDTSAADGENPVKLRIVETVFAGAGIGRLKRGHSCRIMTGAPMPRGADTVIPVEQADVDGGDLVVVRPVKGGRHVRRRGEEVEAGTVVVESGAVINPGVIACLTSLGKTSASVFRKPRVSVITTGDETINPGTPPKGGQIYDSNSHMLSAMLRECGIEPARVRRVGDRRGALSSAIAAALNVSEVLITTGGVSVGEHDYLREVLSGLRVREVFWRVNQKPGKPLYFGVRGKKLVFGLPGNPASSFACFYAYVYEAIRRLSGFTANAGLSREELRSVGAFAVGDARWQFLRGRTAGPDAKAVECLPGQGSHMVVTLAHADRLIVVPAGSKKIDRGTRLATLRLPGTRLDRE